jgi:Lrp/AsnC family leucine-responsive transcriptional regulator
MTYRIDEIDAKILKVLQVNCKVTGERLGHEVGLSVTACQRRVKLMEQAGVIERQVAVVDPRAVGRPLSMILLVSLERERADIIDEFQREMLATEEVMSAYYVTGETDFVLNVTARDMEDYDRFTRRFLYGNSNIKQFKTLVVLKRVKASFSIPVRVEPTTN